MMKAVKQLSSVVSLPVISSSAPAAQTWRRSRSADQRLGASRPLVGGGRHRAAE